MSFSLYCGCVRIFFVLRTSPSHVSIPPNQNDTMAKAGLMRRENVLRKIQTSKRSDELAFVFRCVPRIRLWPLMLDDRAEQMGRGVMIGQSAGKLMA